MNKQNTKTLFERYPRLYRGRGMSVKYNLMPFGFECGDGWFEIIDRLSLQIETECMRLSVQQNIPEESLPIAVQVKEKFGGLRFYMSGTTDAMDALIAKAYEEAKRTCEQCGAPGNLRDNGWMMTLCDSCQREHLRPR